MTPEAMSSAEKRSSASPAHAYPAMGVLIDRYRPRLAGFGILLGYLLVLYVLQRGWQQRGQGLLIAESGLGYALGIIGGSLMLLLLLYPLRKRLRFMATLGKVQYWFRMHMLFGVLGPVCILFHCSFRLGSLNSNVALICMLLVASSGLVGRYFYAKIHHGLYGQKANIAELQQDTLRLQQDLDDQLQNLPEILALLSRFEDYALQVPPSIAHATWRYLTLGLVTWRHYFLLRRHIRRQWPAHRHQDESLRHRLIRLVTARLGSIRKLAEFHFYERMFSLWHVIHLPLFILMVITGVVLAVHMY